MRGGFSEKIFKPEALVVLLDEPVITCSTTRTTSKMTIFNFPKGNWDPWGWFGRFPGGVGGLEYGSEWWKRVSALWNSCEMRFSSLKWMLAAFQHFEMGVYGTQFWIPYTLIGFGTLFFGIYSQGMGCMQSNFGVCMEFNFEFHTPWSFFWHLQSRDGVYVINSSLETILLYREINCMHPMPTTRLRSSLQLSSAL